MLETIIRNHIVTHMSENDLFTPHQHGFIPGRSFTTQLLDTINSWYIVLDRNLNVDVVYLDFAKAFNSVPHKRLLNKLHAYGIRGKVLCWIEAYLLDLSQKVAIQGSLSSQGPVLSGIPQGSVLGPILFLLYVNDLPDQVLSECRLFTNDTKIWITVTNQNDS